MSAFVLPVPLILPSLFRRNYAMMEAWDAEARDWRDNRNNDPRPPARDDYATALADAFLLGLDPGVPHWPWSGVPRVNWPVRGWADSLGYASAYHTQQWGAENPGRQPPPWFSLVQSWSCPAIALDSPDGSFRPLVTRSRRAVEELAADFDRELRGNSPFPEWLQSHHAMGQTALKRGAWTWISDVGVDSVTYDNGSRRLYWSTEFATTLRSGGDGIQPLTSMGAPSDWWRTPALIPRASLRWR